MSAHLCLVSQTPELSSDRFPLTHGKYTFGRSSDCELVLKSPTISRVHAQIVSLNSEIQVTDLGSTNGTYMNGERVGKCVVRPGERISFGLVALALTVLCGKPDLADSEVETDSCDAEPAADEGKTINGAALQELLSIAQQRIFDLLVRGLSEKDVAEELCLSPHTVHNHVQAIYRAFRVHSRAELLAGFLHPNPEPVRPRGKSTR